MHDQHIIILSQFDVGKCLPGVLPPAFIHLVQTFRSVRILLALAFTVTVVAVLSACTAYTAAYCPWISPHMDSDSLWHVPLSMRQGHPCALQCIMQSIIGADRPPVLQLLAASA